MEADLAAIVRHLIESHTQAKSLSGLDIQGQFDIGGGRPEDVARGLNASFLIALSGDDSGRAERSLEFIHSWRADVNMGPLASFFAQSLDLLKREVRRAAVREPETAERLHRVRAALDRNPSSIDEAINLVWGALFPEGLAGRGDRHAAVETLRRTRRVTVTRPNPQPVTNPAKEVLFTSNALLTVPLPKTDIEALNLDPGARARLREVLESEQKYWYDHPIPLGIAHERNEVLHGLKGLAEALDFEQKQRPEWAGAKLAVVLSVSVTHQGLQEPGREYLSRVVKKSDSLGGLDVYFFTEAETERLNDEVMIPAAHRYFPDAAAGTLKDVVGVDGEYGRHYSFLKAVAAWWRVLIDERKKATFKIDLDQVFPQTELTAQTGASAFQHLTSPLWGARGKDSWGEEIELGLLAGALVNRRDLGRGLFTPDVPWPDRTPQADETVFFSLLPQALSTEAEMMARYGGNDPDGETSCLQRIHVTGGTTGALVESLRRHRPFTPSFIGRAEDQAYLLSVLFRRRPFLRYLHQPGLIMRHDKEGLIPEAIEAARIGKLVGDYTRILWFSHYARVLPWPLEKVKAAVDPFTGCFISPWPYVLACLRLALKAAGFYDENRPEADLQALNLLRQGSRRLGEVTAYLVDDRALAERYVRERDAWDLFYDILDRLEEDLARGDAFALDIQSRARRLVRDCRA